MGRRRVRGRAVDGILLLDKPSGMRSNESLQRVKHLYDARKAGHTGSLDSLASGLLPLCLGEATKMSGFLLEADKRYRSRFQLGVRTSTGDADGEVLERRPVERVDDARLREVLAGFTGSIEQLPSWTSIFSVSREKFSRCRRCTPRSSTGGAVSTSWPTRASRWSAKRGR